MGILQEYRFYLIIAVIALAAIISLFFSTQNSQELVDFNTNVKSNFAAIKGQASDNKSLYDVVTIDGTSFRGMKNDQLFGLTHKFSSNLTSGADADVTTDVNTAALLLDPDFDITLAEAPAGSFFIVFRSGEDVSATDFSVGSELQASTASSTQRGWNLSAGGDTIFVFESDAVAKEVIADYIPEGTLVGNSITVPFLNN